MHDSWILTDDSHLFSFECLDLAVTVDLFRKQLNSQRCNVQRTERGKDCNIHFAILDIGMRSDKRIVTILRSIPASHQKRLFLNRLVIDQKFIRFGFVAQIFFHRIFYIGKRTAAFLPGKLLADRCIKADSAGTKKDTSVRLATVDCRNMPLYNQINRPAYIHRNMQFTRQTIAGTFRDNPQHRT